jgi:chromosome segregation ATPase
MTRGLQIVNFAGVVILAAVCVGQWKINRNVNLEANRLEKTRIEQQQRIEEQDKTIKGCMADLDTFREQIQTLSRSLKETEVKAAELEMKLARTEADREQLKENVARWAEAVQLRDEELTRAREQIEKLAEDRNGAVEKFNELAEKYNSTVQDLNQRGEEFNALVERYNKLAQAASK